MTMAETSLYPRLLGDIGGTNARFALQRGPGQPPSEIRTYLCADYPGLEDAVRHFQADTGTAVLGDGAIGIANPVTGDDVRMTNHHWRFSIEATRRALGLGRFVVLNDFTALALSLPSLQADDFRQVGGGAPVPHAALALLGAGTGLGVSGLWPPAPGRAAVPIDGEGGHVTLAAADALETQVVDWLRQRFGHASAERALSGPGLENLHAALCDIHGVARPPRSAAEITQLAAAGGDALCREVVALFFSLLGTVAGNLALTLGARGGVYIGGGIVPRLGTAIDQSSFRQRFEAKGRFQDYLARIPTYVVDARTPPALLGAARALDTD